MRFNSNNNNNNVEHISYAFPNLLNARYKLLYYFLAKYDARKSYQIENICINSIEHKIQKNDDN